MLDEKNDQLSSESAEGEISNQNEVTPLKSKEDERKKDDKINEEAGEIKEVSKEEKIDSVEDVEPVAQEKSEEVLEESEEKVTAELIEVKDENKEEEIQSEKKVLVEGAGKESVVEPDEAVEVKKTSEIPVFDLAVMSLDEIVNMIRNLLSDFEIKDVKNQIESLKIDFQKKFSSLIMEQKEAFIKSGGEEADFFLSAPVKHKFDELVAEYKKKRQHFYK